MTPEEIAEKLWQKYAEDLPAEKRAQAATLLDEMKRQCALFPDLEWDIVDDAIHALRAWRDTKDVQG